MLGFDALARLPLATSSAGIFGALNVTQAGNTVSAAGAVAVKASLAKTQDGNTVTAAGAVAVKASLAKTQDGNTVSTVGVVQDKLTATLSVTQADNTALAFAGLSLSEAPCVLHAAVAVHGIVASVELSEIPVVIRAVASYSTVVAVASYSTIRYRTCWDVVADREAA